MRQQFLLQRPLDAWFSVCLTWLPRLTIMFFEMGTSVILEGQILLEWELPWAL